MAAVVVDVAVAGGNGSGGRPQAAGEVPALVTPDNDSGEVPDEIICDIVAQAASSSSSEEEEEGEISSDSDAEKSVCACVCV